MRTSARAARPARSSTTPSGAGPSPTRAAPRSARPAAPSGPCVSTSPPLTPQVRSVPFGAVMVRASLGLNVLLLEAHLSREK